MGDDMKKVRPGDPLEIPARTFNTFIDAARDFQARSLNRGGGGPPSSPQTGIVLVKNASGADRDRFDVLGIDSPVITPTDNLDEFKNRVALSGVTPANSLPPGSFVVLLEPIAAGEIGRARISGVCPAKINIIHELDGYADMFDSTCVLRSGRGGGAQILWKESGTGEKWAVILLHGGTTWWRASLIDGRLVGRTNAYVHEDDNSVNPPVGYYVEEVRWAANVQTGWPGTGAQSHTRDSAGNYIPTYVEATVGAGLELPAFWPLPLRTANTCQTTIAIPSQSHIAYISGYDANWVGLPDSSGLEPQACCAKITALTWAVGVSEASHYRTHEAHFMWGAYEVPGLTVDVRIPYRGAGYREYPLPQVGDIIPIGPVWCPLGIYWYDLTPRIPVPSGTWNANSTQVYHDQALDAFGRLWATDI